MTGKNPVNIRALNELKWARQYLTPQQFRTIKGQILAGQSAEAMKGLRNLLQRR